MVSCGVPSNQTCTHAAAGCVAPKLGTIEEARVITAKSNGIMVYDLCFNLFRYRSLVRKLMARTDNIRSNEVAFKMSQFNTV